MLKKIIYSNAIWAVLAVGINTGINFLIVPYVSESIGVEAYGFVTLANTIITYIDVISVALNSFASRYIAMAYHRSNYKLAQKYYSSIFVANLFLSVGIVAIALCFVPQLQNFINISLNLQKDVKILFALVISRYILVLLRNAFEVSNFIKNRLDLTEKIRAFSYVLQAGILVLTCNALDVHVWYVGAASFAAAAFMLIAQIVCAKNNTTKIKIRIKDFSFSCVKDFIVSGIWNSINSIGNLLNSGLDLLITNKMLSELVMGMISVSKTLGSVCYTLVVAISNSFRPAQLKLYTENNMAGLANSLCNSMRITGAISAIVIGGFFSCGKNFLQLWIPSQDINTIFTLSMIVLASDILTGVVNPLYYVFTLTKKLKIPCMITIAMGAVNVVSMFFLIRYTRLAALAVVLTTMVLNLLHFVDTPLYAAYCLGISARIFYKPIVKHLLNCLFCCAFMSTVNLLMPETENWIRLSGKIMLAGMIGVIVSGITMASLKELKNLLAKTKRKSNE